MSSLLEAWDRLSVDGESGDGYVRLRLLDVSACSAFAAKRSEGSLEAIVLDVHTSALPPSAEYPDTRGAKLSVYGLTPGPGGTTRIVLSLADGSYLDVFRRLGEDLVDRLRRAASEGEAVRGFISGLARWQAFLRRHGSAGLTLEARRGLFGELFLLLKRVLPRTGAPAAIASWKGCTGASHDFQWRDGSIEVKTTSASTPHAFHVSSVQQLDMAGQGQLFIYFAVVDEAEAGDFSLPDLIEAFRQEFTQPALDAFEDCLVEAGYLEGMRQVYASPRYSVRRERFFRVDEGFPRLRESRLPQGVEAVRYEVAVSACSAWEVEATEALDAVLGPEEVAR
ncbi:MAG: PD-(D/E)XK motif protein [Deltaproteobacteria bacterium]|nr:PD-(D/E)XK motif protein [Deltaproteobacteria bacterium]